MRVAILLSEERTEEAVRALEAAIAAAPDDYGEPKSLRHQLEIAVLTLRAQNGASEQGEALLRSMLEANPGDEAAFEALLQVLEASNEIDAALRVVESLRGDDRVTVDLDRAAGQLHQKLGNEDDAERALRRVAERAERWSSCLPLHDFYSARGRFDEALAVLEQATERFPDRAMLHLLEAEARFALGSSDAAQESLRRFEAQTFEGDPRVEYLEARLDLAAGEPHAAAQRLRALAPRLDVAATQFWLGRSLEQIGDSEAARRRYALALRRDPAWTAPATALVQLAFQRGDWPEAIFHARRLAALMPWAPAAQRQWAEALVYDGQGRAAEQVARRALERFPDDVELKRLLAHALREQGRFDEALQHLAALGDDPGALVDRVLTLGLAGRGAEGTELARASIAGERASAALHAALASLLFSVGDGEGGAVETDVALALDPHEPQPLRMRCRYRVAAGRLEEARVDCQRYLERRPDVAEAHLMLGIAAEGLGDLDAAKAAYRRSAELAPRDGRPRNNLAWLLARGGHLNEALAEAQEAYRLAPQDPAVLDTLGELYRQKGLTRRAISFLEDAVAGAPSRREPRLHLAQGYIDAGRDSDARQLLAQLEDAGDVGGAPRAGVEGGPSSL
jgi:tetratricopeptide (TPR) repeat protein